MLSALRKMDESHHEDRSRRRDKLKQYYAQSPEEEIESFDPFNINGSDFNPDLYLNKLVKEYSLTELMEKESEIYRQIQCLDSEMQTLVYENYNKFISATDTIRKMKQDFKKMEEEMDLLANNMSSITKFSESISSTLQGKRDRISQLSGTHTLLKKLQFLFELPPRLKKCIEKGSYSQAVRSYLKAEAVLRQYQHMPSFQGIQEDCDVIVEELKGKLRQNFQAQEASPRQLAECVDMLLQLKEHPEQLCEDFLAHARVNLDSDLSELDRQIDLIEKKKANITPVEPLPEETDPSGAADQMLLEAPMDVLEFVDWSCNHFLSNLCLVIASFKDMFLQRLPTKQQAKAESLSDMANGKLILFTTDLMQRYFVVVERRLNLEEATNETALLVRALDRFHRRLQAVNKLLPNVNFTRNGLRIVSESGKVHCGHFLKLLCTHFGQQLTCIRQGLLAPPRTSGGSSAPEGSWMANLLSATEMTLCDKLRLVLADLQAFIKPDVMFASQPSFRSSFCIQNVREGVVVAFLRHIITTVRGFCHAGKEKGSPPPPAGLVLLLSRFCLDLENSTVSYLLSMADDQFGVEECGGGNLTSASSLCQEMRDCAQSLLDCYVRIQGLTISQMLRKSVETRDWMSTIEPRNVRAVMKRVVEDLTTLDTVVGQLYEEGSRREQSSDSSRRTYPYSGCGAVASLRPNTTQHGNKSTWSNYAPSLDNSLMSNIQKLFSEKIEIFSRVEFSKVSVLTGIIKISLKTFLECVRLRTFSRHGLQQAQVDTHYLQLYLWRFVSDEGLVHVLLDEIVGSTIHRCVDPVLMEPSVVEVICERG